VRARLVAGMVLLAIGGGAALAAGADERAGRIGPNASGIDDARDPDG
jgi:hypothetical protein